MLGGRAKDVNRAKGQARSCVASTRDLIALPCLTLAHNPAASWEHTRCAWRDASCARLYAPNLSAVQRIEFGLQSLNEGTALNSEGRGMQQVASCSA